MNNICFVCYDFTIKRGGQRAAINVANALSRKGCKVGLIGEFSEGESISYEINKDVQYHQLISGKGRLRSDFIQLVKKANKIIKEEHYSCVISVGYSANPLCMLLSGLNHISFWHWEHYSLYNKFDAIDKVSMIVRKLGAKKANHFVVLTERSKNEFINKYRIAEDRISIIPNAIPKAAYTEGKYDIQSKKIISVGKVEQVKGYERLIEVAREIKPYANGWEWHIYGAKVNEYYSMLCDKIKKYRLDDFIFFDGGTDNIYGKYKQSSIFVLTSLSECLPMTLLEAKANMLPIVSFDIQTGPKEIVRDGINGYLINDGDIKGMSTLILKLIQDSELRKRFSDCSMLDLEKYSDEMVNQQWITELEQYI